MTFGEILLEMAVRYGVAIYPEDGGAATLPDASSEDYRQLVTAANRGYSRFLHRREWTFLTRPLELLLYPSGDGPYNIDGDPARYRIPHWCRGGPAGGGSWRYTDRMSAYIVIMPDEFEAVTRMHNQATGSGNPTVYGIGSVEGRGGMGQPETDQELILWPTPGAAYTIRADFYLAEHKLISLAQRHIAGAEHDESILCEGMWALYECDAAAPERDGALNARNESVGNSIRMDTAKTLGLKGKLRDTTTRPNVTTSLTLQELRVNGVPMTL